ncbi:MAG: DUF3568 family protein [Phycisphaerales bacterium]|nr:MAG: DUF3568 family protein [Phycisphaerales bacterium]
MKKRISLLILLVATMWLGPGCKTTVIEPGTETSATYRLGKLTAAEPKGIGAVYQAVEKAMADLELNVTTKLKDELAAKIVARDSQDKKVQVNLAAVTKDTTKIVIRVGSVEKARRIYQTIHDNLQ